ncbi:YbfB/YjiJ family MFS transporter [Marinobacter bohaiensis]|uniref:YbfB/YjiJ family MFS transporter n=1 Tax=Marinobacter bohaiensis TaxID=2201898 RepID=UPI001D171917|nr:YbfB/YjiJ family MFS transporter [Marinobacter bohaiensis]
MNTSSTVQSAQRSDWKSAIQASMVLTIGMGFGRFAFTAIYPHMVDEGVLSLRGGSLAASANYAGYLLGALLAVRLRAHKAHWFCQLSTLGTALCLAVLALLTSTGAIVAVRGVAGLFSALSMVAASLWLLEHRGHSWGAPLLYAGVGVGIALSAELLVVAESFGLASAGMWLILGFAALIMGLAAAPAFLTGDRGNNTRQGLRETTPSNTDTTVVAAWPLVLIYGLAGLGYIVTATYLPTLVKTAFPDLDPAHVWAVFGLGAAPSCYLWHRAHERLGTRHTLRLNLIVQACGVALPVVLDSGAGYLLSALLVGGTFMGTVTIAMPAAQRAARQSGANLLATMTLAYGLGQIIGPLLADSLYALSHTFASALLSAAVALVIATLISLRL